MSTVIAGQVLANGLRTEFTDTYQVIRNRQADGRIGAVMDLGVGATNRRHKFAYFEAAPHMEQWIRGETVPTDAMGSVQFEVSVYNWARRVPWHKDDRKDDQTSSLVDMARTAGESAALLPVRFFFDLISNGSDTLPAVPTAPDGAVMFATTDSGGANRFGVSSGNLLTGTGVASIGAIQTDYYSCLEQWKQFQDGKGQPMLSDETIDSGVIIIHAATRTQEFEEAFLQKRQGILGPDNTSDAVTSVAASNLVQDASRNVTLWSTSRLTGDSYYVFLKNSPKLPTFFLDREGIQEFAALEGDNNSDHARDTGEEYVQWECRSGGGIALPYGAIKVDNS